MTVILNSTCSLLKIWLKLDFSLLFINMLSSTLTALTSFFSLPSDSGCNEATDIALVTSFFGFDVVCFLDFFSLAFGYTQY